MYKSESVSFYIAIVTASLIILTGVYSIISTAKQVNTVFGQDQNGKKEFSTYSKNSITHSEDKTFEKKKTIAYSNNETGLSKLIIMDPEFFL